MVLDLTDHELIERLRQGDPQADGALWEMLYAYASTLAYVYRDEDVRRDAAASAYERMKKSGIWGFKFECPFSLYCKKIVVNECLRILGRRSAEWLPLEDFEEMLASPEPDPVANPACIRQRMQSCWEELTERARGVLSQFYYEGKSPEEIARTWNTNRNNVNKICHDARLALRRCLEEQGYRSAEDVWAE